MSVTDPERRWRWERRRWAAAAMLLLTAGVGASTLAAEAVSDNSAQKSRQAFERSSAEVVSTLKLAIAHEDDLVVNAAAFIADHPDASNAEFVRWARSVRALGRYPELQGVGVVVIVPRSRLPAFAARVVADPPHPLAADGTFRIVPPGDRPFYCFSAASESRTAEGVPAGLDFCASNVSSLTARDSGLGSYEPFPVGANTWLGVSTPVYRGGVVPTTTAARRATFLGWLGVSVVPDMVLDRALEGHPGTAVTLTYHRGNSNAAFRRGRPAPGGQHVTLDLGNGWTAQTAGPATAAGLLASGSALASLLGGAAISALLSMMLFILATGRARALRLVREKTEQLQHQALHDGLTGLPNRVLILDRIEQALARARRHGTSVAVMFLDLDGFKDINDTFGHAVGDRLLQAVSDRLTGLLRASDSVGRLGGDEFVVLLEGVSLDSGPNVVAERIRIVLAGPYYFDGPDRPAIYSHASIGIAVGLRADADELLRDADIALYEAKDAGKNTYVVFTDPPAAAARQLEAAPVLAAAGHPEPPRA
ncbi:MAG: diguanylate cyclase [Mycobacteriales bacterium]